MNRDQIVAKVCRQLNKNPTPDPVTQARLIDHVNTRHRQILSEAGCKGLRRRTAVFQSTIGEPIYAFAGGEDVEHVRDLANQQELTQRSFGDWREYTPDPSVSPGTPDSYHVIGYQPVHHQPRGPVELIVYSNSLGDTQTAVVSGAISGELGNLQKRDGAVLAGPIPVSLGINWVRVDSFALTSPAVGTVTLTGDTILATLGPGQTAQRYLTIALEPTPSQALNYQVDATFEIRDMVLPTDESWLPSDFHDLLEIGALIEELAHEDDQRLVLYQQRWQRRLAELKLRLARQDMHDASKGRMSRYGSWAPAGPW